MFENQLRFPSGVSVTQAKKDAKRRSKQEGIPLHEALDLTAQKLGAHEGWGRAVDTLARDKALGCFQLPLRQNKTHSVCIYDDAPFITIAGVTGSGKSVLALSLAKQALAQGLEVHFCGHKLPAKDSPWLEQDLSSQIIYPLLNDARFHHHRVLGGIDPLPFESLPTPSQGAVLIVDEFEYISNPLNAMTSKDWPASFGGMVILCAQPPEMFTSTQDGELPPVGLGLFAHMGIGIQSKDTKIQQFIELTQQLKPRRSEGYAEFLAADIHHDWAGVVRLEGMLKETGERGRRRSEKIK